MAKNREPEKTVESSEEDDDASSEEVTSHESDSEPEQTPVAKKPSSSTPATTLKKTQPQSSSKSQKQLPAASSSSSDEESGSESYSDSDGPDPVVKPIASKPMDAAKSLASDLATPAKSAAAGKRPAEEKETVAKDSKKAKRKAAEPESSAKKSTEDSKKLFQRLWSEGDEIAILKGMTDYALKMNADPLADLNAFHDFLRKNLHVDVTKVQLKDKIRRLKKKYMNNKGKQKGGKDRTFSNPHEQKAYELSKNIWGNENVKENGDAKMVMSPRANGSAVKKTPAKGANAPETEEVNDAKTALVAVNADGQSSSPAARLYSYGGSLENNILRTGEEMFALGKWVEKGKEWDKLKMEEIAIIQRHLEVKSAQVKLVLDAMKSEDH